MPSRKVSETFAEVNIRLEGQNEELRPATYRETAAAIFMALAESDREHDTSGEGWSCEIELLDDYCDDVAQVPNITNPTKH